MAPCKHPRVQIVAREEDSEFVECKECGEIFESSEFKDMIIEDTKLRKESLSLRGRMPARQPAGRRRCVTLCVTKVTCLRPLRLLRT